MTHRTVGWLRFFIMGISALIVLFTALLMRVMLSVQRERPLWEAVLARYTDLHAQHTDLETFAQLADFIAEQVNGDYDRFMLAFNRLIFGAPTNELTIFVGAFDRFKHYMYIRREWFSLTKVTGRFGSTGFAADDNSNQVQHFWFAVTMTYDWSAALADFIGWYHEWNAPGILHHLPGTGHGLGTEADYMLSKQGIALGQMLVARTIPLPEVGNWLRRELGSGE